MSASHFLLSPQLMPYLTASPSANRLSAPKVIEAREAREVRLERSQLIKHALVIEMVMVFFYEFWTRPWWSGHDRKQSEIKKDRYSAG